MSHSIVIYTDGSALGNPGPGGWAYLIWDKKNDTVEEMGGNTPHATNNQMELWALKKALERVCTYETDEDIIIYLDSEYVKNGLLSWMNNWKKNGWRTAAKKPVLNKEIWQEIDTLYEKTKERHALTLKYVPGHMGIGGNEAVDEIARTLAGTMSRDMFQGSRKAFEELRKITL